MKNPFVFITRLPFTRVMSVYAAISSTREYPASIPSHLPLTRWWALWFPWLNVSFLDFTEWNSQFKSYTWITLLQPLTHCISLNLRLECTSSSALTSYSWAQGGKAVFLPCLLDFFFSVDHPSCICTTGGVLNCFSVREGMTFS